MTALTPERLLYVTQTIWKASGGGLETPAERVAILESMRVADLPLLSNDELMHATKQHRLELYTAYFQQQRLDDL